MEANISKLSDEELIDQINKGNQEATEILLKRYKELVTMKVSRYFIVGAEKEDIFQEGMIGLYKAIKCFNKEKQKYAPTLIYPVRPDENIVNHELFCPIIPIIPFDIENIHTKFENWKIIIIIELINVVEMSNNFLLIDFLMVKNIKEPKILPIEENNIKWPNWISVIFK